MAVEADADAMIGRAHREFEFKRCGSELRRRNRTDGATERLVDGFWVVCPRRRFDRVATEVMSLEALQAHARRHTTICLGESGLGWQGHFGARLRRTGFWCWLRPPLQGGAPKLGIERAAGWAQGKYEEDLGRADDVALTALTEQAAAGFNEEGIRLGVLEQRANFFLGAAGITTTLVVASSGLLLGAKDAHLHSPWLQLAATALVVASACSLFAALRAAQAAMAAFGRWAPSGVEGVIARSQAGEAEAITRAYIGALQVGTLRNQVIGNWKMHRLKSARRWFAGMISAMFVLTLVVLLDALTRAS